MLKEALKIPSADLNTQDQLSLALFIRDKRERMTAIAFYPMLVQPISQFDGIQFILPALVSQTPLHTAFDYRSYLARLHGLSAYVDGVIDQLRQGIKTGWVAPRVIIEPVPAQLRELRLQLQHSPMAKPFEDFPAGLTNPDLFAQLGKQELTEHVAPALARLEKFISSQYLPACRASIAASDLPGGAAYYAFLVSAATSTDLSPAQVHALGLAEVERLRGAIQALMEQTGFHGSVAEFSRFLNHDPRFHHTNVDDSAPHAAQLADPRTSDELPAFRRYATLTAFREGWVLYAQNQEAATKNMNDDPLTRFMKFNEEMRRTLPLVVDTGIHAMDWDRDAAIAYLNDNSAASASDNSIEVNRIIARPAQALAAKIGQLSITALRDKTSTALGEKFDQHAFDQAVLANGALPLSILETQMDIWSEAY